LIYCLIFLTNALRPEKKYSKFEKGGIINKTMINRYFVESTYNTPSIDCNADTGIIELKGKSIPENATKIYHPVVDWLKEYIKQAKEETHLHLDMEYFNTASSIWIAKMVKALSQISDHEKLVIIHLYFHIEEFEEMEEEDLKEAIAPVIDVISVSKVSIGVKIYGKDDNDTILKEKLVLF
jgi:hypothetical protein